MTFVTDCVGNSYDENVLAATQPLKSIGRFWNCKIFAGAPNAVEYSAAGALVLPISTPHKKSLVHATVDHTGNKLSHSRDALNFISRSMVMKPI